MAAAMRAAFARLGFTDPGPTMIVGDQGIDHINILADLDDEEVETLLKLLRRPGGTIANPNAGDPGQPAFITAPGISVSMRAATNLKLAVYYCRHMTRTSRLFAAATVTTAIIRPLKPLRDEELAHTAPTETPSINPKNWPKTLEALFEFFSCHLGVNKAPLSYVIRTEEDPPVAATDPAYGSVGSQYGSYQDEIVCRAPIKVPGVALVYHSDFISDNKTVWEMISKICREEDCWTIVKPFMKKKDGRKAYRALYDYYLGKKNVDNQATASEKALEIATWSHNTKRFDFDAFVKIHLDNHLVLSDLTEHGYAGIDDRSKVRHLLKGIKSTKLDSVKTAILASDVLRSDFNGCVALYKDFMTQNEGISGNEFNISGLKTGDGAGPGKGRGKLKKRKHNQMEIKSIPCADRYYSKEEYKKLSQGNRKYLKEVRDVRVGNGGTKDNNVDANKRLKSSEAALSILTTAVDNLEVKDAAANSTSTVAQVTFTPGSGTAPPTNSTNSALSRIATRQQQK